MRGGAEPPSLIFFIVFAACPTFSSTLLQHPWRRRGDSRPLRRGRLLRRDQLLHHPRWVAAGLASTPQPRRWPPRGAGAFLQGPTSPLVLMAELLLAAGATGHGAAPATKGGMPWPFALLGCASPQSMCSRISWCGRRGPPALRSGFRASSSVSYRPRGSTASGCRPTAAAAGTRGWGLRLPPRAAWS